MAKHKINKRAYQMDKRTLKALQGSIRKWEKIVEGTGEDNGTKNCPLCGLYYDLDCTGCPVSEETGQIECTNSPYEEWDNHNLEVHSALCTPLKVNCGKCRDIAQKELAFLKTLLPKEKIDGKTQD